jgi:LCP family protein required for cell wall assembly
MDWLSIDRLKSLIPVIFGFTLLVGIGYFFFTWNTPINSPLGITPDPAEQTLEVSTGDELEAPQNQEEIQPTKEPVCGGPPSLMVLVTGVASKNYLYGLADAIRVARIDFQNQEITVLAVPRDLWVAIPGLETRGIEVGKLNQAYFYGTEGMGYYTGGGYGSGLLAETLHHNYGLITERYISVNLKSFRGVIDAMGGLDIYLPHEVYKRVNDQPVLFLEAGSHHLNGKEVELLARQRISIGDLGRINNQTIILRAIAAQMLTPSGITAIPAIIEKVQSNVLTDLSPAEISQLVCLVGMLDFQEDIHFSSIPQDVMSEQLVYDPVRAINTAALVGDEERIKDVFSDFKLGFLP